MTDSWYIPHKMKIAKVINETSNIKTFRLQFLNAADQNAFDFRAGQFAEYSIFGEGESTFCIASSPTRKDFIECTFRITGRVTNALAGCEEGEIIGFRGPYGNSLPLEDWYGKNIVFVAGGIALPPLRCVIWNVLDMGDKFGHVTIVYGAKSVDDLVYKEELEEWSKNPKVTLAVTVDPGGDNSEWKGHVGFVPDVLRKTAPAATNSIAIVCGPPIMIKLSLPVLQELGFSEKTIYSTLENRMKCGFGQCGHCMVGEKYVCKDGPVFSYEQIKTLPLEY